MHRRSEDNIPQGQIVLIGMMGAGKTTVGRLLAARLGRPFWDNDDALEEATGKTAAEFQGERGQVELHETEDRLLRDALRTETPTVFAAAAAAVLDPDALSGTITVWLRSGAGREAANIARSGEHHRPLPPDATTLLRRLGAERLALYTRAADITVDARADPTETCDHIVKALHDLTPSA